MDLDQFLSWYFSHNTLLINLVIVAILALVALTLFFSLWRGKDADVSGVNGTINDLEKTLRRVLESAPLRPATEVHRAANLIADDDEPGTVGTARSGGAGGPVTPEAVQALEKLKQDVSEREKVILDLRTSIDNLSKNSSGLTDDQKARIAALEKELQVAKARLSEYEIIEDDIANLSLYKAENTQLKGEIEKLRRGKGVSKDDANSIPQVSDIVAEFAAIVGAEDNATAPVTPTNAKPIDPTPAAPPPAAASPAAQSAPAQSSASAAEPTGDALAVDPGKLIAEAADLPEGGEESAAEEQGDSGQKLINEFESFIKNG